MNKVKKLPPLPRHHNSKGPSGCNRRKEINKNRLNEHEKRVKAR
jgi:hypothetical protein